MKKDLLTNLNALIQLQFNNFDYEKNKVIFLGIVLLIK
jgi:hypothetical protein